MRKHKIIIKKYTKLVALTFCFALLQACDQSNQTDFVEESRAAQSQNENEQPTRQLKFSTESLEFGFVAAGDTAVKSLTVTHVGHADDKPITIQSTSMDELDSQYYTNEFYGSETIYPGESVNLILHFTPEPGETDRGDYPATLFITHTGPATLSAIRLNGQSSVTTPTSVSTIQSRAVSGVSFSKSSVDGIENIRPTSLQFGPDGRLYVADMIGGIKIYNVQRLGDNNYTVIASETINLIKNMPNHNDDGQFNPGVKNRLVTGLLVAGTASKPIIYVASSDPRIGGGTQHTDTNLDTNSTILSKLTFNGSWSKQDVVRGLPRSEENHHANGMILSEDGNRLLLAMGGNTNSGAPSNNFALLPEYALSAAILEIDLAAIGNSTYDLPTLDDEDRPGSVDANDPFGGNQGKNQAKLVAGGPVQIFAPGFRNAYDLVRSSKGKLYSIDNGPNSGWGGVPQGEGSTECSNAVSEPGNTYPDSLHLISGKGYYAGHANPTRGSTGNVFNSQSPQSPVPWSNSIECDYRVPGTQNNALITFPMSTNGFTEYTASNFNGLMSGDLIATGWNNKIYRMQMNHSGTQVMQLDSLFSNFGERPLDVIAQGDNDIYPGTIWVADFGKKTVFVFEPSDYGNTGAGSICLGTNPALDEDEDGFSNADENANDTDACSAADQPTDNDGDKVSDLLDTDDDNDGLSDAEDPFALDPHNGANTSIPFRYDWENSSQAPGGIANLGFTGLMNNGSDDYLSLFDLNQMTVSGAAGVLTVDSVPVGDAIAGVNNQEYAFQLGINVAQSSPAFTAHTRVLAPFSGISPAKYQSVGFFIGSGDQDNYIKLVVNTLGANGGLQFLGERDGGKLTSQQQYANVFNADAIDLYLDVNPATLQVSARYQLTLAGERGSMHKFPVPLTLPAEWLNADTKLAVGLIATSFRASPFAATWDLLEVSTMFSDGAANSAPVVDTGPACVVAQISSTSYTCGLQGLVSDDGLPTGAIDVLWTKQSGPGTVSFSDAASAVTTAQFSAPGLYKLRLLADDGQYMTDADMTVQVETDPVISVGSNIVYRLNSGGPTLATGDAEFVSDLNLSAAQINTGVTYNSSAVVDTSAISAYVPSALFASERYASSVAPPMKYSLPVTPGDYEVRLYFAEVWSGAFASGKRVFDVSVEGTVLKDIDIYAEAGPLKALVKTVVVNSDSSLNIDFIRKIQNPAIKGIEVIRLSAGQSVNQPPTVSAGADRVVNLDDSISLTGTVSDDGFPDGNLAISWSKISGPGNVEFVSASHADTLVSFSEAGEYLLQLAADDGERTGMDVLSVVVVNDLSEPEAQQAIRINVGGPAVTLAGNVWLSDASSAGYVNTGNVYAKSTSIDLSALNAVVPEAIFQTERWDQAAAPEMAWNIPVVPGEYEVRLYFAEIYSGAQLPGKRIFSVTVEDTDLGQIDVFSEVGADAALMRSVTVTADSTVTIDFAHIKENPALKGIEIIPLFGN